MTNLFRRSAAGLLGSMLIASLGSTAAVAQDVTIRIAHFFTGSSQVAGDYDGVLDAWEAAHPEVRLVREESAGDDQRIKLATDLAANNVPDLYYNWAQPAAMKQFIDAGLALDVREYLKLSPLLDEDYWTPSQLAAVTFDGAPYMLPTTGFKCFMVYNTAIFKEHGQVPPTNWDELVAVSKVFKDAGIVPINIGSKGGNPGHLFYNAVLGQLEGGQAASEATATTKDVSSAPFRQAGKIISNMKAAGAFPSDTVANGDWGPSVALYNQSKAAMLYTCPWMISHLEAPIADVSELMYFPTVEGAAVEGKQFNVGAINNGWMINKQSFEDPKKQAALVSLVDAMFDPRIARATVEKVDFPAWNLTDVSSYELSPLMRKVYAFTATSPDTYGALVNNLPSAGALTALLEAMDKLFAGDDPDAVFDSFQAAVDRDAQ